jgi:hypothetical protein
MNKRNNDAKLKVILGFMLLCHDSLSFAIEIIKPPAIKVMQYTNKPYHFLFNLPIDWEKQSGDINSTNALFMQSPLSHSCSFQFNITPLPENFPAEMAVRAALKTAIKDVKKKKLLFVKRRDFSHPEKVRVKEKGLEKEMVKSVLFMRGWEIMEYGQKNGLQRLIYQGYDKENHYFHLVAAANSDKFAQCQPQLRHIMDSVLFGYS